MLLRLLYPPYRPGLAWLEGDEHQPLVAEVQRLLGEYCLYQGAAHGHLDSATIDSVRRFQELRGLSPTGRIDPVTYCLLLPAAACEVEPTTAPRATAGLSRASVLITKSVRRLTVYDGNTPLRQFPVAIGKTATPTPEGNFAIAVKIMNPGGVLGSRWMGLNYDAYGIHGTNAPWKIGQMVSNGCIRMHNANAEELFAIVRVGTPVLIRN